MALPAVGGGPVARQPRAAQADPHAPEPHALSQDADQRPPTRGRRLHKILEDTGIKLGCVATNIIGKSGRDMLDALVAGTTDPSRARRPRPRTAAQEDPRAARSARSDASTPSTR